MAVNPNITTYRLAARSGAGLVARYNRSDVNLLQRGQRRTWLLVFANARGLGDVPVYDNMQGRIIAVIESAALRQFGLAALQPGMRCLTPVERQRFAVDDLALTLYDNLSEVSVPALRLRAVFFPMAVQHDLLGITMLYRKLRNERK